MPRPLGARDGEHAVLLIANISGKTLHNAELSLTGVDLTRTEIYRIDQKNPYRATGESIAAGSITLPPYACVEIVFS